MRFGALLFRGDFVAQLPTYAIEVKLQWMAPPGRSFDTI